METKPFETIQTIIAAVIDDEQLREIMKIEPAICQNACQTAVSSLSTARHAAGWVAHARFSERLADIATAAGALEDAAVRDDAVLVFQSLENYAVELMTTEGTT